ncbi:MAG: HpcH/HpaI aldolase/citrate lyase family protein [Paracoccus sp. (in: a-proteobacteria)]|uniref:HpcH/HpaI aldolase/citrate lyase family protein n=1 Tax=Paracoccus sp. TaxID=267 RepID=UPI00391B52CB
MARPMRSALYIPAANPRAMEKARGLPADVIIFDLEDAVAPEAKVAARDHLASALAGDYGGRLRVVRINGLATGWGADDAAFAARVAGRIDAVLLPKVGGAGDLDRAAALLPGLPLWAMVETPGGVLEAPAIAAHPRLAALVMGTNDLAKELNARFRPDRLPLLPALGACLLAARARGRVVLDGVFNAFRDGDGLRAECAQGRDMGFDGKTLIHPDQLAIANEVFAPSAEEIDLARRQIAAFEEAVAQGRGVAVLDGRIVENLHVETARRRQALAEAIAASGY